MSEPIDRLLTIREASLLHGGIPADYYALRHMPAVIVDTRRPGGTRAVLRVSEQGLIRYRAQLRDTPRSA